MARRRHQCRRLPCLGCSSGCPSLLDPPIAFAHRGARAHAPENTIEAFALALRLGATGLESDVWLTSDGVPVLDHDGVVRARLPVAADQQPCARDQLPDAHPGPGRSDRRLRQPTTTCRSTSRTRRRPATVVAVVREAAPALLGRLWLCYRDWRVAAALRAARRRRPAGRLHPPRPHQGGPRAPGGQRWPSAGVDAINLHHSDWTGGLTTLFHRFERYAFGWDAQHERVLQTLLRMGIDGVYSDWVDRMTDAFRAEIDGMRPAAALPARAIVERSESAPRTERHVITPKSVRAAAR